MKVYKMYAWKRVFVPRESTPHEVENNQNVQKYCIRRQTTPTRERERKRNPCIAIILVTCSNNVIITFIQFVHSSSSI